MEKFEVAAKVTTTTEGGYGFHILNEKKRPIVHFEFATEAEATIARRALEPVVARAKVTAFRF